MKKKSKTIEEIEEMAMKNEDISEQYEQPTRKEGTLVRRLQRVNIDFTEPMLTELDVMSSELNISRQAVIKMFVRQALDQHYLASNGKKSA